MGKVKNEIQKVYDECTALYEKGGVSAVCDHVIVQQKANNPMYDDVKYHYCKPCEAGQPDLNNVCLVCGSATSMSEPLSADDVSVGETIYRVAELRYLMEGLDDNDQICIETIDVETGDTQDLYPMAVDVINGIQLTDGSVVREVRFCQRPNCEPDTRNKQPLVDAVIEELKSDIADGDTTVLDELLMKLPWEILKGSLPEDMWEKFNHDRSTSIWSEIRNDFEDEGIVSIDAWITGDDNEGGEVIAKVDVRSKAVKYLDDRAKTDSYAQEMIAETLLVMYEDFSDEEILEWKHNWGQSHCEITSELGFPRSHAEADELIQDTGNYFWNEKDRKWYNRCASMFTEREQQIADHLYALSD
jgi:hypothetical protein